MRCDEIAIRKGVKKESTETTSPKVWPFTDYKYPDTLETAKANNLSVVAQLESARKNLTRPLYRQGLDETLRSLDYEQAETRLAWSFSDDQEAIQRLEAYFVTCEEQKIIVKDCLDALRSKKKCV
jgi:hypothetical protein